MGPSTLVLVLKYYKYSYESTCTYTKVLPSFLHSNCTCIQVLSYVFTSTKILVSILKYFEVHLSPFNLTHQVNKVNSTQVHVEGSFEPPSKKSKILFSFMPESKVEIIPFQSHSNTDNYLASPCISIDTNPAKY